MHLSNKELKGGRHVSNSHSTLIESAACVVQAANADPCVSNIVLGVIKGGLPGTNPRIKFTAVNGGIRVTVRGNIAEQQLYVYTTNPAQTRLNIEQIFREST